MPHLDARHLFCPLPVIRVGERVRTLAPGDVLTVSCTDRGALQDIPAWCRLEGHELLASRIEPTGEVSITIRVHR
ncbi:MAG: sulfurtransferase TusA family protein [Gammaproteobacteria bacterium]|nr:sulfurtransferase TusA family protein [Gammaproteobacteria bacterium]